MSVCEELEARSLEELEDTYDRFSRPAVKCLGFYHEEITRREPKKMAK